MTPEEEAAAAAASGTTTAADEPRGEIRESLNRTNAQIRKDRGEDIFEGLETEFKRAAEDSWKKIKRLQRERRNMYDFSPNQTTSLVMAKDVDYKDVQLKDEAITLEIRNTRIKHELDVERYRDLFGITLKFE